MKLELVLDEGEWTWTPRAVTLDHLGELVAALGPSDVSVQVVLTGDDTLREHNREYRGQDRPTDVLSFSYFEGHGPSRGTLLKGEAVGRDFLDLHYSEEEALAGQVLVSLDTLRARGPVHAQNLDDELAFMVVHGLLHVLGFDHGTDEEAEEMQAEEKAILQIYHRIGEKEREGDRS